MPVEFLRFILVIAIVATGTAVQAAVGFGMAMIAAPLLLLVEPAFVPGPMIAALLALTLAMAWKDRHALDFSHFGAAIAGRVLGTPLAILLLGTVSAATFDMIFGVLVLLAVGMSLVHTRIQPTPRTVFLAMIASGFMGTLSSIGGPPLALVYQNSTGPSLRANLSALFVIGTVISLAALSLIGRYGIEEMKLTAVLLVGVVIGIRCSGRLIAHMDGRHARPYLLALCAISACGVLLRALLAWAAQ